MLFRFFVSAVALCLLTSCDNPESSTLLVPSAKAQGLMCTGGTKTVRKTCDCKGPDSYEQTCSTPLDNQGRSCGSTTCTPCACPIRPKGILEGPGLPIPTTPKPAPAPVPTPTPTPVPSQKPRIVQPPTLTPDQIPLHACLLWIGDDASPFTRKATITMRNQCNRCVSVDISFYLPTRVAYKMPAFRANVRPGEYHFDYDIPAEWQGSGKQWIDKVRPEFKKQQFGCTW